VAYRHPMGGTTEHKRGDFRALSQTLIREMRSFVRLN
jgi:hypothetical protein